MISHPRRAIGGVLLLAVTALSASLAADGLNQKSVQPAGPISSTITFLYYDDLMPAARFYGETLGLSLSMDEDWVKVFSITGASSVGLVKKGHGFHEPTTDKPVMLSLVTTDVDAWQERLAEAGTQILKPLPPADAGESTEGAPIRGFIAADPGGYTVEFFSWQTTGADR